jgi:ribosomal protein S27AE
MGVTGARGRCPACGAALGVPADQLLGERRCPRCSADLWMLAFSRGPVFFPRRPGESLSELLVALAGPALGATGSELEAALQGVDHFDLVELLCEVEDVLRARGY